MNESALLKALSFFVSEIKRLILPQIDEPNDESLWLAMLTDQIRQPAAE